MRVLNRFLRLFRENGSYVVGTHVTAFFFNSIRNYLLSRKFGVEKINIGPRSYLRGLSSMQIGEDFSALEGLWLEALTSYNEQTFKPRIIIGQHARISRFVHIAATHLVEIGNNVLIGSNVMITDHNHGQYSKQHSPPDIPPTIRPLDRDRQVYIGNNVWLGDGVVVTPGSSIGEGSVIGANSVVLGNIPPFSIAAGVPATVRKTFKFDVKEWGSPQ